MCLFMLIMQAAQKNTLKVAPFHMGETMMKVYTYIEIFMFVYETNSGGLAGANIKSPQLPRKCMYCFTACKTSLSFLLFCIR